MTDERITRRVALGLLGALPAMAALAQGPEPAAAQPELPKERLVIVTHDGMEHSFSVEMATTTPQQTTGLMFRAAIPPDGGMLFDWGSERNSQMWMRNTISPLDMLFIGSDGTVRRIAEHTVPQSLAIIDGGMARATLELAAGTAERLDIRVGDHVKQRIFGNA